MLFTHKTGVQFLSNFPPALPGRRAQIQGVTLAGAVMEVLRVFSHLQVLGLVCIDVIY